MEKYIKVQRQDPPAEPNEIRLPYSSRMSSSIEHGLNLLKNNEQGNVFMRAIGSSLISKAIFVAEILKHRVAGLHQITEIGTIGVVTEYLPKEEGLDRVEVTKQTPFIRITLSRSPLDSKNPGYQPPIPESMVQPRQEPTKQGGSGVLSRGGSSGGGGGGRGRGYRRGRGRGGYSNQSNPHLDQFGSDGEDEQDDDDIHHQDGKNYEIANNNINNTSTTSTITNQLQSGVTSPPHSNSSSFYNNNSSSSYRGSPRGGGGSGGYRSGSYQSNQTRGGGGGGRGGSGMNQYSNNTNQDINNLNFDPNNNNNNTNTNNRGGSGRGGSGFLGRARGGSRGGSSYRGGGGGRRGSNTITTG